MRLLPRKTFFQWLLKFVVQTPLVSVVSYRLVEVLTQVFFIEFKIRVVVSHHAFVLQNMVAFDLNGGLFAAFEVVDGRQISLVHFGQSFADCDSKNLASCWLLRFPFFEPHQEVPFLVQVSFGGLRSRLPFLFEEADLDTFFYELVVVEREQLGLLFSDLFKSIVLVGKTELELAFSHKLL
jgi:hypothetical protein